MKKAIPFFCAASYGVFGALLITCGLNLLSMLISPFYRGESPRFFAFCTGTVILSALLIVGTFLLNVLRCPEGKDHRGIKRIVACEILLSIVLLIPCWALWERVIEILIVTF